MVLAPADLPWRTVTKAIAAAMIIIAQIARITATFLSPSLL